MTGLKQMALLDAQRSPPARLRRLLETNFFEKCSDHPEAWRSTRSAGCCNFFCTTCAGRALCSRCLGDHAGHEIIQVCAGSSRGRWQRLVSFRGDLRVLTCGRGCADPEVFVALPCEGGRPAPPAERVIGADVHHQRRAGCFPRRAEHVGEGEEAWRRNRVRGMRSGSPGRGLSLLLARMQGALDKISPGSMLCGPILCVAVQVIK